MTRTALLTMAWGLTLSVAEIRAQVPTATPASPSFLNEVVPLLTRHGCNQGACHGKGAGQNGFRLSLRGYAPEWDHEWITREFTGRRLNPAQPEKSLLLLKPTGVASHEGGKLFQPGDRAYQTLLHWIRAGAPGPSKTDIQAQRLQIAPASCRLQPGQEQQLQVRAEFAPGQWQDVTWLCKFDSNDPGMTRVDASGKLKVLRQGETAVRVTFQTQVSVVVVTAPFATPVASERLRDRNNLLDEAVLSKLGALGIEPSDLCSDAEFIRRAFLDTLGVLPKPEEVRAFLADARPDKRQHLVDSLLQRPEFNDHWAQFLGDLLQNRRERDHDVRGVEGVRAFHDWLRKQVAENRKWDEIARAVLTASGSTKDNPAVGYFIVTVGEHNEAHRSEVVASVAQSFLGTRIGCAQCHNHPLERYTQDDYYHFAAFFSRLKLQRKDPKQGPTVLLAGVGYDGQPNKNPVGVQQPRTHAFLPPRPLDRSAVPVSPSSDPRLALANWITSPQNEAFSGAMVNRLWRHFMGVGLVEPVDDLRASNPPSNPALWQALNQEMVRSRFDLRHVMRLILNSRTYQRSSATRPSNRLDTRFSSHYLARRLPAEVLLDALATSTGVPDAFPDQPGGTRAGQLADPGTQSYFLTLFGRSNRVTACACERSGEVTLPQLLHLMNGESVIQKIASPQGRLEKLLKSNKTDEQIRDELFLATLSRLPTEAECQAFRQNIGTDRAEAFRDLFWALLNSKEFAFNH